ALIALKALWSGEPGYKGRLIQIEGGVYPLPAQKGGPPLWVGGKTKRSARRAAQLGDAWYASTSYTYDQVATQSARYREALAAEAKPTHEPIVSANRITYVGKTREQALKEGWPSIKRLLDRYI